MNTNEEREKMLDYLSGDISPEGRKEFDAWLKASTEREQRFKRLCRKWKRASWSERWHEIDEEAGFVRVWRRLRIHRRHLRMVRYAAAVILACGAGMTAFWMQRQENPKQEMQLSSVPKPGERLPVLTLGNGQSVVLADNVQAIAATGGGVHIALKQAGQLEYVAGADTPAEAVAPEEKTVWNTLEVPKGCEFSVALADGSRVWLNAESKLKYPERFTGSRREVELVGEGYFEVAPRADRPFVVRSGEMELRVLGTVFNISAYPEMRELVTTLITGSVAQRFGGSTDEVVLTPSFQSVYSRNDGRVEVHRADLEEVLAWKNEKFVARNERLEDIFRMLARWYDFEVSYTDPSLKEMRFHLHCPRYGDIGRVLATLQATQGIRFTVYQGTVYVSK